MLEHFRNNKKIIVLYIGILITQFANMVEPMLTILLQNKFSMSAFGISVVLVAESFLWLLASITGGILADYCNKKMNIVICDSISAVLYLMCAVLPISNVSVGLMILAGAFQHMEIPSYSTIFTEMIDEKDRDTGFSMYYLFWMIGMLGASAIAGFFVIEHTTWIFIGNGVGVLVSSLLIFTRFSYTYVKPEKKKKEKKELGLVVFRTCPILIAFLISSCLYQVVHNQHVYLLPMELGRVHGESGAEIYGLVLAAGSIYAIAATTLLTKLLHKKTHLFKNLCANIAQTAGFAIIFAGLVNKWIPLYYIGFFVFTVGEILSNISYTPYLMEKTPERYRGRISGIYSMMFKISAILFNPLTGGLYDRNIYLAWGLSLTVELIAIIILGLMMKKEPAS